MIELSTAEALILRDKAWGVFSPVKNITEKSKNKQNWKPVVIYPSCEPACEDIVFNHQGLYPWKSVNTMEVTQEHIEVSTMKGVRLLSLNLSLATVIIFTILASVFSVCFFTLPTTVGMKALSSAIVMGSILSIAFIWYNVFYRGFKKL